VCYVEDKPTKTLFVRNLSFDVTKESLEEAFQGCTRVGLPKYPDTLKPKG